MRSKCIAVHQLFFVKSRINKEPTQLHMPKRKNAAAFEQNNFPFAKAALPSKTYNTSGACFEWEAFTLFGGQGQDESDGFDIIQHAKQQGFLTEASTEVLFQCQISAATIPGIIPLASCYEEFTITRAEVSFQPGRSITTTHTAQNVPAQFVSGTFVPPATAVPVTTTKTKYGSGYRLPKNGVKLPSDANKELAIGSWVHAATKSSPQPLGDPILYRGRAVLANPQTASGIDFTKPFRNHWYPKLSALAYNEQQKDHTSDLIANVTHADVAPAILPLPKGPQWFPCDTLVAWADMGTAPPPNPRILAMGNQTNTIDFFGPTYAPAMRLNPLTGPGFQATPGGGAYGTIDETSYKRLETMDEVTVKYRVWVKFRGFRPVTDDDFVYMRRPA